MNYLLDFDRTLMDTDALRVVAEANQQLHLVGTPEFWEYYRAEDFLYFDVLPWLKTKSPETIHILTAFKPSHGEFAKSFQEGKIFSGGLAPYIGGVTVMEGEKGESAVEIAVQFPPQEPIIFVDDLVEQCMSVKTALPHAECFLMCRKALPLEPIPAGIHVVATLEEVDVIMGTL